MTNPERGAWMSALARWMGWGCWWLRAIRGWPRSARPALAEVARRWGEQRCLAAEEQSALAAALAWPKQSAGLMERDLREREIRANRRQEIVATWRQ